MPDFVERQPDVAPQEVAPDQMREQMEQSAGFEAQGAPSVELHQPTVRPRVAVATPSTAPQAVAETDPVLKSVEEILSDGLMGLYATFPEDRKATFREKGEQTARKLRDMIVAGKAKVLDVLRLIRVWLHTIPGVSKFFLEQEAKIKTDRILGFSDEYRASHV